VIGTPTSAAPHSVAHPLMNQRHSAANRLHNFTLMLAESALPGAQRFSLWRITQSSPQPVEEPNQMCRHSTVVGLFRGCGSCPS
jgi:hypothetical protein